jgi:uncharacterized membrane protein YqaE (UPF0057 family)
MFKLMEWILAFLLPPAAVLVRTQVRGGMCRMHH